MGERSSGAVNGFNFSRYFGSLINQESSRHNVQRKNNVNVVAEYQNNIVRSNLVFFLLFLTLLLI